VRDAEAGTERVCVCTSIYVYGQIRYTFVHKNDENEKESGTERESERERFARDSFFQAHIQARSNTQTI
jgi:hypothetical protein